MPTHKPDLQLLSISQLAELCGMDRRTITARLDGKLEPERRDGKTVLYVARAALPVIYQTGEGLSLEAERARLAKEQADAKAMENEVTRGTHAPTDQTGEALIALASNTQRKLLAVPARVAAIAFASESTHEVEQVIRGGIEEALADLCEAAAEHTRSRAA